MTLCGFEIAPGEKQQVKLPVPGGVPLEAWLLCGAHPGKTLVVTAGVHGCEYVGILALQKLVETLDCATLYGQVILLPLVNSKGFFAGVKQLNPADGRNLNREFPGKEDGTETQRMAWTIEKLLYPEADFLLDLHGGDWNEELEEEIGMTPVLWSLDSLDWKLKDTGKIIHQVLKDVKDGDIILLHDIFPSSVEAALELVDILQKEGYVFVTADELLIE